VKGNILNVTRCETTFYSVCLNQRT